ncbi:hypothetical protein NC661_13970 [Aquibacillus koreensis]|uniref:Uncharacterized protein n=1 Tax=Aquibacillus koreensis TaxID=279446 RepID=A0A9X4AKI9_9BACI|nr:hypothetical protein [Aquibacillus koreensis]MCT2536764.1 hypothetical protein [Aquibacillus koreensis]MDC3421480.1 hypothetical protein [Aquibacillus koreensis]
MPSAWLIGPLVIKSSLVVTLVSFIVAIIFYRFTSPFPKMEAKQHVDQVGNILITFIFSLWIGKILLGFATFIKDPIAILAYPSDSNALYIGLVFTIIYVWFKYIRKQVEWTPILYAWICVFLTASFINEFVQIISGQHSRTWGYLGVLIVLLFIILFLQEKYSIVTMTSILLVGWGLGQLLLKLVIGTTVFQFNVSLFFYSLIMVSGVLLFIFRKKV